MTDEDAVDAVLDAVRERVTPDETERARLRAAAAEIVERTETAAAEIPVETDVVQVGSTARDTWLSGDRDIDVFVRFPPELDRERLTEYGLAVGHEVLPDGREEYAEHPYVVGEIDGFDVDLVPCYRVDSATEIQSSVDRTPFHTEYVEERIDAELAGEIRVFKAFLSGIGAYGSDLRTRGVSGYLSELLVIEYGSCRGVLEAAADWTPPIRLDPVGHAAATFDDPLVVIDPTDPERNVAAVVAPEIVARIVHYAREFCADPDETLFEPADLDPLTPETVREQLRRRETAPVAVRLPRPDVVDDQLYPQLRKSLAGIVSTLDDHGFDPLRSATFADDEIAVLLVECAVERLPAIERHEGPPVHVGEHARRFYDAYADDDSAYGPFIENDRFVVERPRSHRTPGKLLRTIDPATIALGVRIAEAFDDDTAELLTGEEIAPLADRFGTELASYFDPSP